MTVNVIIVFIVKVLNRQARYQISARYPRQEKRLRQAQHAVHSSQSQIEVNKRAKSAQKRGMKLGKISKKLLNQL